LPTTPGFEQELAAIREDAEVKRFALRRAGDLDLAEDALQAAYDAVARVADRAAIRNLRAYFCRTVINEIYRERGQLGAAPTEDITDLADRRVRLGGNSSVSQPIAEAVSTHLLTQAALGRFATQREELNGRVTRRSPDPGRYREVIVKVANQVLAAIIVVEIADADYNTALRAAYPEWFAEPGCPANRRDQRFRRARADVRALLQTIINREDLYP
jgi:DNA-directed RNA polymerase specialized sigma24 family protein